MINNMLPYGFDQINIANGTTFPSTIKPYNNVAFMYWCRSLLQRVASVIDVTCPWHGNVKTFVMHCLFNWGFGVVFNTDEFGFVFQPCTVSGYNLYYQPTDALVSNPTWSEGKTIKLGSEGNLLQMTPDYHGIMDIIFYYAEKLASIDVAINTAIINSKIAWVLGAFSKSSAETLKKALDLINQGNPAVVYDKKKLLVSTPTQDEPWQKIDMEVKKNYILTDLLRDLQTILNDFDSEIGIPNSPYQKKERMVTSEAESKVIDSQARATTWVECLNESALTIKELFPDVELSFKLRFENESEEVSENG